MAIDQLRSRGGEVWSAEKSSESGCHWLRGGEIGELLRFEQRGQNNWLIKFERLFPGGGIEGDKLWLSEREFAEVLEHEVGPETESAREKENEWMPKRLNGSSPHRVESRDSRQNGYV